MKWQAKITEVGSDVKDLLNGSKMFDLVREGRRDDMRDFTVHFSGGLPEEDVMPGDTVKIGNAEFFVVAIGNNFNRHLKDHEACTVEMSTGVAPQGEANIILDGVYENYDFLVNGAEICLF